MTRVKLCGITRLRDARLGAELGAWAVGLIFHAESPRACPLGMAADIGAELHREVALTGVFRNAPLDDVIRTAARARLSILQLHGDEGPAYCAAAAQRTGCAIMKAARVRGGADVRGLAAFREADFHLLDTHSTRLPGGTGETFDWELVGRHRTGRVPLVLAGGLTPENVGEAIETVRPWGVDTASGTESRPGRKDQGRVREFFAAVEAASARAEARPREVVEEQETGRETLARPASSRSAARLVG
jgi:phosphoribosylanthranilate isomerase